MSARQRAVERFAAAWGGRPEVLSRAPGRVNLIGDHTDHQDGFVLPMAVDREVWLALRTVDDPRVRIVSAEEPGAVTVALPPEGPPQRGWGGYIEGVLWSLGEAGYTLGGWEGAVASDVPVGAGLSSSAALELAVALGALAASGQAPPDDGVLARLAQRAENDWVGMSCGIMDQLAVTAGRAGHALRIDCRTLEHTPVPMPAGVAVLVLDTGTRRELASSAYNSRRADCDDAARRLGVAALRDVDAEAVAAAGLLDPLGRRARHVVTENARVNAAADALAAGDCAAFGRLMSASHASLRDDYEASTPELEAIVSAAAAQPACYGARLTGAGFGGCAVALVEADSAAAVAAAVSDAYHEATGQRSTVYVCEAAEGAVVHRRQE